MKIQVNRFKTSHPSFFVHLSHPYHGSSLAASSLSLSCCALLHRSCHSASSALFNKYTRYHWLHRGIVQTEFLYIQPGSSSAGSGSGSAFCTLRPDKLYMQHQREFRDDSKDYKEWTSEKFRDHNRNLGDPPREAHPSQSRNSFRDDDFEDNLRVFDQDFNIPIQSSAQFQQTTSRAFSRPSSLTEDTVLVAEDISPLVQFTYNPNSFLDENRDIVKLASRQFLLFSIGLVSVGFFASGFVGAFSAMAMEFHRAALVGLPAAAAGGLWAGAKVTGKDTRKVLRKASDELAMLGEVFVTGDQLDMHIDGADANASRQGRRLNWAKHKWEIFPSAGQRQKEMQYNLISSKRRLLDNTSDVFMEPRPINPSLSRSEQSNQAFNFQTLAQRRRRIQQRAQPCTDDFDFEHLNIPTNHKSDTINNTRRNTLDKIDGSWSNNLDRTDVFREDTAPLEVRNPSLPKLAANDKDIINSQDAPWEEWHETMESLDNKSREKLYNQSRNEWLSQ